MYILEQKTREVPTYAEVVGTLKDFQRREKLLKNQTVAAQFSDPPKTEDPVV